MNAPNLKLIKSPPKLSGHMCDWCGNISEREGCGGCRIPSEASESRYVENCECNPFGDDSKSCEKEECIRGWIVQ